MSQSIWAVLQLMPCPDPGQELFPLARDCLSGSGYGLQVGFQGQGVGWEDSRAWRSTIGACALVLCNG